MAEKRKDKKGRILKTGESQRKDGTYQYRYKDSLGKYRYVYSDNLNSLREKSSKIQEDIILGVVSSPNELTVYELTKQYVSTKKGARYFTTQNYATVLNFLKNNPLGNVNIQIVKMSDAKRWFITLQDEYDKSYAFITRLRSILKPAFQYAYEDDMIKKNPFDFKLSSIITNDMEKREAVDDATMASFLNFIKNDAIGKRYYDETLFLLETGLRIGEFCGLTKSDIDIKNRKVKIRKQLAKKSDGTYFVSSPKTKNGIRDVPLSDEAIKCITRVLDKRKLVSPEPIIDGYCGFIFLNGNGKPMTEKDVNFHLKSMSKRFRDKNPGVFLPKITPHVLRHTFCTKLANGGVKVQNLSYIMGHGSPNVTLGTYTHSNYASAEDDMKAFIESASAASSL